MVRTPVPEIESRAIRLADAVGREAPDLQIEVVPSVARSGGGTLPTYEIPSFAVRLGGTDPEELAERLRSADPPVVGRVREDRLWLDARTLLPGDEEAVVEAVRQAIA